MAAWNELPAEGGSPECEALVDAADRLRWSAPELAVQFAVRALANGTMDPAARTRAQELLGTSLVGLGRHAEAVEPALIALRAATGGGLVERAATLRIALAACARALGEPLAGCEALRPVLQTRAAKPATRALALGQFVACAAHVGGRDDLEDALAEADRLLAADEVLSQDGRRLERALLCVRFASYHRRHGDTEAAAESARDGLTLLNRLTDKRLEGGRVRGRLALELVCALLDDGDLDEAAKVAAPSLGEPVRATSAPALGRMRLAVATRVHLPAGRTEVGRTLLVDVIRSAERHGLDSLLADTWTFLAHAEEQSARPTDALHALRSARAAEHRHLRAVELAKHRLSAEFGSAQQPERAISLLRATIRPAAAAVSLPHQGSRAASRSAGQPVPDPARQAPTAKSAADKPSASEHDVSRKSVFANAGAESTFAVTLVRVAPFGTVEPVDPTEPPVPVGGDIALNALATHVRDLAPDHAELLRSDRGEFAVLLPRTSRDEAECLAATIRAAAVDSAWLVDDQGREVGISTAVAAQPAIGDAPRHGIESLLQSARDALSAPTPDSPAQVSPPAHAVPKSAAAAGRPSRTTANPTDRTSRATDSTSHASRPDHAPSPGVLRSGNAPLRASRQRPDTTPSPDVAHSVAPTSGRPPIPSPTPAGAPESASTSETVAALRDALLSSPATTETLSATVAALREALDSSASQFAGPRPEGWRPGVSQPPAEPDFAPTDREPGQPTSPPATSPSLNTASPPAPSPGEAVAPPTANAQSLLSRFGITPAPGGGRRRAPDEEQSAVSPTTETERAAAGDSAAETGALRSRLEPEVAPRATIPVVPEPDDVPEPPSRPDIPDPVEPDPIPPVPLEPSIPPDDPLGPGHPLPPEHPVGPGQPGDPDRRVRPDSAEIEPATVGALLARLGELAASGGIDVAPVLQPAGTGALVQAPTEPEPVTRSGAQSAEVTTTATRPRTSTAAAAWLRRAGRPLSDGEVPAADGAAEARQAAVGDADLGAQPPSADGDGRRPRGLTARRDRTASSGLANLLAEALVAFQSTHPEWPQTMGDRPTEALPAETWAADPTAAEPEPTSNREGRRRADEVGNVGAGDSARGVEGRRRADAWGAQAHGVRGRHRSSEWAPADLDGG
ncbi:hypothetical protein [Actinokineospora sp.]|uniref:hypothetical protein n=1 Tax=Actinokineospora sp. TaxID=1872133 RepID=UPI0040378CE2